METIVHKQRFTWATLVDALDQERGPETSPYGIARGLSPLGCCVHIVISPPRRGSGFTTKS